VVVGLVRRHAHQVCSQVTTFVHEPVRYRVHFGICVQGTVHSSVELRSGGTHSFIRTSRMGRWVGGGWVVGCLGGWVDGWVGGLLWVDVSCGICARTRVCLYRQVFHIQQICRSKSVFSG
jgi:hypothetical protein